MEFLSFFRKPFFILFLGLSSANLSAKDLIVGVIDVAPYGYTKDKAKGLHAEYLSAVLKKAQVPFKIIVMPYPRVISSLQKGKVDLTLLYKRKDLKNVREVGESIGFKNVIISRSSRPLNSRSDLKGKKIATVRSAKYDEEFDKASDIQKVFVNDYLQSISLVASGRADGAVISEPALIHYKALRPKLFKGLKSELILNTKRNYLYAHSSVSPETLTKIATANKELLTSQSLNWFVQESGKNHP